MRSVVEVGSEPAGGRSGSVAKDKPIAPAPPRDRRLGAAPGRLVAVTGFCRRRRVKYGACGRATAPDMPQIPD